MTSESAKLVEASVNEVEVEHTFAPPTRTQSFKMQISQLMRPTKPFLPLLDIPFVEKTSIQKLPAQDGGWPAWRVLDRLYCPNQLCIWQVINPNVKRHLSDHMPGFYLAFGVFRDYYTLHAAFEHASQSGVDWST